jgi:hypothetical protein
VGLAADATKVVRVEEADRSFAVFVVLARSVFADFVVVPGRATRELVEQRIAALREKWSDSSRLADRLVSSLASRQRENAALRGRIAAARHVIVEARRVRRGEEASWPERLWIGADYVRRLEAGEDPLDVVEAALEDEGMGWGGDVEPGVEDPLRDHRL